MEGTWSGSNAEMRKEAGVADHDMLPWFMPFVILYSSLIC